MIAIIDSRQPRKISKSLESRGFKVIGLPPFPTLSEPVSAHPDMLMFIASGVLLTHRDYYAIAQSKIDTIVASAGLDILLCDAPVGGEYPHDILFNVARVGRFLIGKQGCITHQLIEICRTISPEFIDVKQGYAKCSTCVVSDTSIITSDRGIASAARTHGIDSLLIRPGHVSLPGYDTGFIGGASGMCGGNVYFSGNLDLHPDAVSIRAFCATHGKTAVSLSEGTLFDGGSILFV